MIEQRITISEHTRLLAWLMFYHAGKPLHTIYTHKHIEDGAEPSVRIVWLNESIATQWNMMRSEWV